MKIFLDTANLNEIKKYADWGIIDGVTTNPSLVAKEGVDFETRVKEICTVISGPVSAEVISITAEEMIEEGRKIREWATNVFVKIPMTPEGLKATKILAEEGTKINMTLIFSAAQAVLAAKAGAALVSPFVGRLDDVGNDGMDRVAEIVEIFENYSFETEVLAASIRSPLHFLTALRAGADIATIPPELLDKLVTHPLTESGLEKFLKDWEKMQA